MSYKPKKFWPYKVVCILLYGTKTYMTRQNNLFSIHLGQMALQESIEPMILRGYFRTAQELEMLADIVIKPRSEMVYGRVRVPKMGLLPDLNPLVPLISEFLQTTDLPRMIHTTAER